MDWHDWKHLADGPVVENGLEDRKIAEVLINELLSHFLKVLGQRLGVASLKQAIDRCTGQPVELLRGSLLFECQVSQFKQQRGLLAFFGGVVENFEKKRQ